MPDGLGMAPPQTIALTVPQDLGELLLDDGFDEAFSWRGNSSDLLTVALSIGGSALQVGADGITVLLGIDQLGKLIGAIRRRKKPPVPDAARSNEHSIEMRFDATIDGDHLSISVTSIGNSDADRDLVAEIEEALTRWVRAHKS